MDQRKIYIEKLEEFKLLLDLWINMPLDYTRSKINNNVSQVKSLLNQTASYKEIILTPIRSGLVEPKDPFDYIFNPKYKESAKQSIVDMIDEAIGVLRMDTNFSLTLKHTELTKNKMKEVSKRVFLVHGHDNELKESTARFLEKISLQPIILHEQINKGKTIIEKFEEYSDVAFAVVLLTPDDYAGSKTSGLDKPFDRARQNVIFEMGYFIGKLGRQNVVGLVKGNIELPSDYSGVMYIKVDEAGSWKYNLAKEIKAAGLDISIDEIFE